MLASASREEIDLDLPVPVIKEADSVETPKEKVKVTGKRKKKQADKHSRSKKKKKKKKALAIKPSNTKKNAFQSTRHAVASESNKAPPPSKEKKRRHRATAIIDTTDALGGIYNDESRDGVNYGIDPISFTNKDIESHRPETSTCALQSFSPNIIDCEKVQLKHIFLIPVNGEPTLKTALMQTSKWKTHVLEISDSKITVRAESNFAKGAKVITFYKKEVVWIEEHEDGTLGSSLLRIQSGGEQTMDIKDNGVKVRYTGLLLSCNTDAKSPLLDHGYQVDSQGESGDWAKLMRQKRERELGLQEKANKTKLKNGTRQYQGLRSKNQTVQDNTAYKSWMKKESRPKVDGNYWNKFTNKTSNYKSWRKSEPMDLTGTKKDEWSDFQSDFALISQRQPRRSTRSTATRPRLTAAQKGTIFFIYPMNSSSTDKITVLRGDLERCAPGVFLNDNLVDFYLRYLLEDYKWDKNLEENTAAHIKLHENVHIYSSFFFNKLTEVDGGIASRVSSKSNVAESYDRVARWTKNVDIFSKRYLIIPINESLHWSVAIVCNPGALLNEQHAPQDEDCMIVENHPENRRLKPCILILDSLSVHSRSKIANNLRDYLKFEWKRKKQDVAEAESKEQDKKAESDDNATIDVSQPDFTKDAMRAVAPLIPQQNNSTDCGVYLLEYVERFFKKFVVQSDHVTENVVKNRFREHFGEDWFASKTIRKKREKLEKLLNKQKKRYDEVMAVAKGEGEGETVSDSDDEIIMLSPKKKKRRPKSLAPPVIEHEPVEERRRSSDALKELQDNYNSSDSDKRAKIDKKAKCKPPSSARKKDRKKSGSTSKYFSASQAEKSVGTKKKKKAGNGVNSILKNLESDGSESESDEDFEKPSKTSPAGSTNSVLTV